MFFEFSGSMVRSLILGKFSAIITSNNSSALFSLSSSDIQIVHRLYLLKLYHGSWMFCSVSLLLLLFIQLFFFGHVEFLEEPIRGIPHFCYCFFFKFHSLFIAIYSISPTPLNIWVVSLTNNTSVSNLQKSCVHMQEYLSDKVPEVEYRRQKVNAFIVLIDITFCILSSNVPVSLLPLSCW